MTAVPSHKTMALAVFAGLAALALTTPAPAQQTITAQQPRVRVITMEEAIQLALTNDLDILISRQSPIVDEFVLEGTYGAYDPIFGMQATHQFSDLPAAVSTNGETFSSRNALTFFAPSLAGVTPIGTQYQLSGPINHDEGVGIFPGANYNGSAGISLDQPLLRNLWMDQPRLNIALAKKTLRYDQLGLRLQIMTVINSVKAAYYNLIYDRQNVDVQKDAVKLAEQLASENKKKVELGSLAPLDETQAESQVASSRADLLTAEQTLAVQENTIKSLMALNLSEWAYVEPVPAEQLVAVPENPDVLECWRTALQTRPDLLQAKVNLEKQRVTLSYDYNQLFPQLDLQASYGQNGVGSSVDKDFGAIQRGSFKSYSYGAVFSVPLERRSARAAYRGAKAGLQQLLLQYKKVENSIITTIQDDVTVVQSDLQTIDSRREARVYAEDALTAEQTKLEHGKSTSFVVLQLQNNLTTARSAEIRALADYNIALEQLAFDEGTTLERNKIRMDIR